MNWLWISGWAVPPAWFAAQARSCWPGARHHAVAVNEAEAAFAAGGFDALGAYSLGTLWLLRHAAAVPDSVPVFLFAPTFAFPAEENLGGRIPRAQLRAQLRRLHRDPVDALLAFARLSGLAECHIPAPEDELSPEHLAALDLGLRWLDEWSSPPPPPPSWRGWVGGADALLDADRLADLWPALHVVAGAGHAPAPLLRAAASAHPSPVFE